MQTSDICRATCTHTNCMCTLKYTHTYKRTRNFYLGPETHALTHARTTRSPAPRPKSTPFYYVHHLIAILSGAFASSSHLSGFRLCMHSASACANSHNIIFVHHHHHRARIGACVMAAATAATTACVMRTYTHTHGRVMRDRALARIGRELI